MRRAELDLLVETSTAHVDVPAVGRAATAILEHRIELNGSKLVEGRFGGSPRHVLITYQAHLARSTAWIAPWGACNGRRIGPNGLHDAMSVARTRFPCRCGAGNMRFVRNQASCC